ncbi:MAG TPA: heavy-metal-associated domain-containing protein [Chloroflexi bacterium]|jgi:copper chaperone|nr:heavy-metal-associated domain-containing protein [Chloroflexota bacterium]HPO57208.1 heavy-metal-associated domain-containing protein [Anaerolineaceae bacterium]
MQNLTFRIPNMSCSHCLHTIKMELTELEGVKDVTGSPADKVITVSFDAPADEQQIRELLEEINYAAE